MKEISLKLYQCEYCGCVSDIKGSIAQHEDNCWLNPNAKTCVTCQNGVTDYDRHDNLIVKCSNGIGIMKLNCTEHVLCNEIDKDIVSEFTHSNAQSVCSYLRK